MIRPCRAVVALLLTFAWHTGGAAAQEPKWRDAATLEIEGKGWKDTAGPFARLPESVKDKFSEAAWQLGADSAGVCVRFVTDAAKVSVRWSLTSDALDMPHMPATGVSGVDLYARSADGSWRFVGNGRPHKTDGNLANFEFPGGGKAGRECLLYLPLYNGTKSLEIGVPPDASLEKAPARPEGSRKPVVVYGTSIAQGGCASRPGMVWTSILGRMLDRPVINLGFSGSGTMAPPVAEALAELDPAAFVIDCTWNMGDGPEVYIDRVTKLVRTIRKARPDTPIIFVGQSHIRPEAHPTDLTRRLEAPVLALQKEGVPGLVLVPGDDLIGDDGEGTVDGVHPNDLGMDRQARALLPIVRKIVDGPETPQVYIDTDMSAEIDDSYAVFRALVAPEFHVVGLSSIGFEGPADFATNTRAGGKMIEEILALTDLTDRISHPIGALHPMPDASTPVDSPAARDIIARAKAMPAGRKLQVFALGAFTNVASALLLDPSIRDNLTVHVMGYKYDDLRLTTDESNAQGDLSAAACLLKSGVDLYVMPNSTLRRFQWDKSDVDAHFKGKGGIRDYLVKRWEAVAPNDPRHTQWDIAVFEAVLRPDLAALSEAVRDGRKLHIWTQVDVKGMQADYWAATAVAGPAPVSAASKPDVYIDADTGNEVDDPYAIFRALVAPEFHVVGLSSAGWGEPGDFGGNTRTSQKMNEDVLGLLKLKDRISHPIGALNPMPAASTPVDSPAARDIIAKAKAMPDGKKLQVFVLGAYTNVASALRLDPGIKDRMVVHVMGFRFDNRQLTPNEFNSQGDLHAAASLLKSGVDLYVMPNSTTGEFQWTKADVDAHFKGKGGVPDYLVNRWETFAPKDRQRILWDIAVFEAILRPNLATLSEVDHDGRKLHVWTRIDIPGMQADYWKATNTAEPASGAVSPPSKPQASVDPIVISRGKEAYGYQAFPDACRLKNGDILAVFYAGYNHVSLAADDFPLGGRICMVRSSDEGRTWTEPAVLFDDADDNRDPHVAQLDDGTLICTFFSTFEQDHKRLKTIKDPKLAEQKRKDTGVQIVTSHDDGKTWDAKPRSIFPEWVCSAPVRQLPDGTCVLGLYRGDEKTGLSIAGTARSTDRGLTWEKPVAIKAPPGVGLNAETDVIRLEDGRLYAAMRSWTDDMYEATSTDEARSWTDAKKAGFPAHCPHLNRLSTGAILLGHRLPKTSIHVSRDDARTWLGPYLIDSCIGAYPATVELKDHSILIIYYTEGGGSAIRARRFNLKPDGIEFLPL